MIDLEALSARFHDIYQKEAHRRGDVRHPDSYADLSEATKEWDRVLARWVLEHFVPRDVSAIYGVSELAAAAGISPDAIRQRCARGTIPEPTAVLRNGRVWQGEEIEEWIEKHAKDYRAKGEQGHGM